MPQVRDYTYNYTTSTSGTTIVLPVPAYEQNDLLLAFIVADTGTATWTASGWTELMRQTNTCQLTIMYKIATSSEADTTFTASTSETFHGNMISIKDINTTYPFGNPVVTTYATQAASAKYTMPTITTNVNNALVMYFVANSGVGVPSLIEGGITLLTGQDGTAESSGVGWTMKPIAGLTSSTITCSNIATGAGVKAVIQIAPPSGGATIVPAFCAADSSIYVNPIHGTTAYNSNAALAATADTLIGTTLGGVAVVDATVAATADAGLNTFHSVGALTTASGVKSWCGATIDLASANLITTAAGKNILVHTSPSTSGQLQRTPGIDSNKKGIAFGLLSTTNNWKAWYVHAAGSPFGAAKDVPLIINTSNTSGLIESYGTLNTASIDLFAFWVSSIGISTVAWYFYSLWVLDTTTVCGGLSTNPIGIDGIVSAVATGHERRSIIKQGVNQCVIYQPIQIGNGGTDTCHLKLDSTAIEFPEQFNISTKQINYCSVDNVAGITYYAGANDTIKHKNSIISSPSKYHWKIHSSSSTSATYDFSGLSIIGAGDIQLKSGITLSEVTFSSCDGFNSSGATLTNCNINTCKTTDAITVTSPTEMSTITNCNFTGNTNAIKITTAGTYTFDNINFSGNTYDINVTASSGEVIINVINGGNASTYTTSGATVTINNSKTLTLTGIVTGSEVRIYKTSDGTELYGIESSSGNVIYTYNYTADIPIEIKIVNNQYKWMKISTTLTSASASIPVQQEKDMWYSNPV